MGKKKNENMTGHKSEEGGWTGELAGFMPEIEPVEEKKKPVTREPVTIHDAPKLFCGVVKASKCKYCGHHEMVLDLGTGEDDIPLKPGARIILVPKTRKESIFSLLKDAEKLDW